MTSEGYGQQQGGGGGGGIVPLYGVTIHHCIAGGDLGKMKGLLSQAEKFLAEYGDISAAVEVLKVEIAKAEGKKG